MIDYNKLQEAHNLAYKLAIKTKVDSVSIGVEQWANDLLFTLDGSVMCGDGEGFYSLDELILRIKEITSQKPKYKVGQQVCALHLEQIIPFTIEKIDSQGNEYWYSFRENEHQVNRFIESIIYPSRQALIESQVEYWQSLSNSDESSMNNEELQPDLSGTKLEEYINGWNESEIQKTNLLWPEHNSSVRVDVSCEHESDGYAYVLGKSTGIKLPQIPSAPHNFKCKKCGKFYR